MNHLRKYLKKNVEKITIQEIADNCDLSSATFYRHFKDKYDLITWDYVQDTSLIMKKLGKDGYVWRKAVEDGVDYFHKHRDYLKNLLKHTSGYNAFIEQITAVHIELLTNEVKRRLEKDVLQEDLMLLIKIYCYGTVELSCRWIIGDINAIALKIEEAYMNALPEALKLCLNT